MKHFVVKLCVFLLLGAVVNVGVAWGVAVALRVTSKQDGSVGHNGTLWCFHWHDGLGVDLVVLQEHCGGANRELPEHVRIEHTDIDVCLDQYVVRAGWPAFSTTTVGTSEHRWEDGLRKDLGDVDYSLEWEFGLGLAPVQREDLIPRALPLRPIRTGFAINTLFYAAILWLLFAAPGSVRRWRRIRRGLCAKCAYPVGTSGVCTECGAAVKPTGV